MAKFLRVIHSREFLATKADDFGLFTSLNLCMAAAAMICSIIWDFAVDPANAMQAIRWRLIASVALIIAAALAWQSVQSVATRLASFVVPLFAVACYIHILSLLDDGVAYGVGGILYFFMFTPFVMFAQPVGFSIVVLASVAAFAPIASPFGLSAGFDWRIYNAYAWLGFFPIAFVMLLMEYLYWHLYDYRRQVAALATTDSLTRITNRRHFLMLAADELSRHAEQRSPISLLFIDIDHFKAVNDRYGHPVGDTAICHVAQILAQLIRSQDVLARYGGEEFVALLPGADQARAIAVAERMRLTVERQPLSCDPQADRPLGMAISIGVASCTPQSQRAPDVDALLHEADLALYEAKNAGRNRVVVSQYPFGAADRRHVAAARGAG